MVRPKQHNLVNSFNQALRKVQKWKEEIIKGQEWVKRAQY